MWEEPLFQKIGNAIETFCLRKSTA